jgi:hypothetical protein
MIDRTLTLRLVFGGGALALTVLIVWAMLRADLWDSVLRTLADPWGVVMLADLYIGFILTGLFVAAVEKWRPHAFLWMAASFVLGNVAYGLWGAWRGAGWLARLGQTGVGGAEVTPAAQQPGAQGK